MHGAAVSFARKFQELDTRPDFLLATDMLDLATFLGLAGEAVRDIPVSVYFHENQLTYPKSEQDTDHLAQRDNHYGFINYTSALAADEVLFNSNYHQRTFLEALQVMLERLPDHREKANVAHIAAKSRVVPLQLDLKQLDAKKARVPNKVPLILWNHRWEHDKNPQAFFECLFRLQMEGLDFEVVLLGERHQRWPAIFDEAQERLKGRIVQFGPVASRKEYAAWLHRADVLPVTSQQDFFGISLVEALYCEVYPLLPNRLVFPEHLPQELHQTHLYHTNNELFEKLKALLRVPSTLQKASFKHLAEPYAWKAEPLPWLTLMGRLL